MTEPELFVEAQKALIKVVTAIKDDQWELMAPPELSSRGPVKLRELINYHTYDDSCVPDVLAGKGKDDYPAYGPDMLGDNPKKSYKKYAETAMAAVRYFDDLDKVVHLSYGDWSARDYLLHITSFRGFRSYDLAKFLGQDTTMDPKLVAGMTELLLPHADEWRKYGIYQSAIEVPTSASPQDKLLAATGRQPK